jgi:ParB-like nuclease domain
MKLKPKPASVEVQRANQLEAIQRKLGAIGYVPADSLTPYEGNPRKHPEKQIVILMASIREFGVAMPILIDATNVVIAGHAVLEAAKRLGIKHVPVLVVDQWSSAQVRAYRLSSNRLAELSQWDDALLKIELAAIIEFDETPIDILGWETGEIDLIQSADDPASVEDPADVVPELTGEAVTKPGDLWCLGKHRLLCASSLEPANWARVRAWRSTPLTVARFLIAPPAAISPIFIFTMSQPRSLLSIAKSKSARSRSRRCSSRKNRIAQTSRGFSGRLAPTMLPAFQGRRPCASGSRSEMPMSQLLWPEWPSMRL